MGIRRRLVSLLSYPKGRPKVVNSELSTPTYLNRHCGEPFLVLGNGPSLNKYRNQIYRLIEKQQPVVLGGNNITEFVYPTYHAFTNRKRFISYAQTIDSNRSRVLLSPYLPPWIIRQHYRGKYERIMYVSDRENSFNVKNGIILAECRTVSVLLIAVALIMGAGKIWVAGLDGYGNLLNNKEPLHFYSTETDLGEVRAVEQYCTRFLQEISNFMLAENREPFKILTPTSYKKHYDNKELIELD